MADLNNLVSLFGARPVVPKPYQPQNQQKPDSQEQSPQQQTQNNKTRATSLAPLNVVPNDDTLQQLVDQAKQVQQNQGRPAERGSILNLVL